MELSMKHVKTALPICLFACGNQAKDPYTLAGVHALQKLLKQYHGIKVGIRWIYQCLRDLTKAGIITRIKRYTNGKEGYIRQLSGSTKLTVKGLSGLVGMRVKGAFKAMKAKIDYNRRKYEMPETKVEYIKKLNEKMDRDEKRRLEDLAEMGIKPFPA